MVSQNILPMGWQSTPIRQTEISAMLNHLSLNDTPASRQLAQEMAAESIDHPSASIEDRSSE